MILVHVAVFFFGFPGVIGKLLPLNSIQLTWFRVFLASLGLVLVLRWQKEKLSLTWSKDLVLLLLSGALLAFHWTAFFQAVRVSTVAVGLLSYSTFPVFTIFLEPWLLKLRFRKTYLLFALVCFLGVSMMVSEFRLTNRVFLGVIWGIASGLSFSFLTIINRVLSPRYSSLLLAFYQDGLAMIFLLPLFLKQSFNFHLNSSEIFLLLFLGLVCTAAAHSLFIKGLRFIEAQLSSLISALEPVYGILLGYAFLREIPDTRTLIGGILILTSAVVISLTHQHFRA